MLIELLKLQPVRRLSLDSEFVKIERNFSFQPKDQTSHQFASSFKNWMTTKLNGSLTLLPRVLRGKCWKPTPSDKWQVEC